MSRPIFDPSPSSRHGGPMLSLTCDLPVSTRSRHPCQAMHSAALRTRSPFALAHIKRPEVVIQLFIFPTGCQLTPSGLNAVHDLMALWHELHFYVGAPRTYFDPFKVRWAGLGLDHLGPILNDVRRLVLNRTLHFVPRYPLTLVHRPTPDGELI